MEYLFEFLLDLTLDGLFGLAGGGGTVRGKNIPRTVRWAALILSALVFLAVFGFILGCGVLLLKTSVVSGLIVILLGLLLLAGLVLKGYYHLKRVREKRCEQEGEEK
ncbi:MAG: hypothetical protein LUD69_08440 [Oscillospiraceae bacterium]|nr:hypothetical protein [Oscillospiraceae bacterium]